ncbi:hypothetical protein M9458_045192, partial [Cirrhinus mrigala]
TIFLEYWVCLFLNKPIFAPHLSPESIMTERTDQTSDSAGSDHLRAALHQQGVLLGSQAAQLNAARREVEGLNAQVADLMLQSAAGGFPFPLPMGIFRSLTPIARHSTMEIPTPVGHSSPSAPWSFRSKPAVMPLKRPGLLS